MSTVSSPATPARLVGSPVERPDVPTKFDGSFEFSNDLAVPGMLFAATVRSPQPHATLGRIDASEALTLAGVVLVLTAADIPGQLLIGHISPDQPALASDVVRHEGEAVAVVVATSQELAWKAADLVAVGYRPLPAVTDPQQALEPDAPLVHPAGNLVRRLHVRRGGHVHGAPVEVTGEWSTGRQDQLFLGPESALAIPDDDGGVTLRLATQDLHTDRPQIAHALGLDEHLVRLEMSGIGGAFGGREDITLQVHLCLAALRTRRPVKQTYRRGESFLAHPKRHPVQMWYRLGADLDGSLRYLEARLLLDGGAYASTSGPVTGSAAYFAAGPYRIPAVDVLAESVYTNNPISGAMRGFGAVQACFGIESTIDLLADRLGMDPIQLRRHNALRPGDRFPTSDQVVGEAAPVLELIDRCAALPLPAEDSRDPYRWPGGVGGTTRGEGVRRGVGFALGVKNHLYGEGVPEEASASVTVDASGAVVHSAASEVGQGIWSALLQIAGDELGGIPVRNGPATAELGYAGSSSASRQTWMSGGAVRLAAADARRRLSAVVGARFGVEAETVELVDGAVQVDGRTLSLAAALDGQVVQSSATYRAPRTQAADPTGAGDVHVSWMFVAHRAVVDVDVDLGLVKVVQVATAQDVGRVVNPREVRGQIDGGISQGLGLAVMEHLEAVEGKVLNASLTDYLIPTAADVPPTEVALVEVPDPLSPLAGAKGVGEPPSLSSTAAIAAAVRRATGRPAPRVPIRPDDLTLGRVRQMGEMEVGEGEA